MTDQTQNQTPTPNMELMIYRLVQLEAVTEQSANNVNSLVEAIREQSAQINLMIERHDTVRDSNSRLWVEVGAMKEQLQAIKLTQAEDRPVITSIRGIGRQITTILVATIVGAIVAPVATTTYVLSLANQKAPTHETTKPDQAGHQEQQPRKP